MKRRQLFMAGISLLAISVLLALPVARQLQPEPVDLSAMAKIREEGLQRSKVMETASYLTDVFGPRLTNSPNIKAAAQWTTKKMTEWGLTKVNLETWGPFGRGWSNERTVCGDGEALCVSAHCLFSRLDSGYKRNGEGRCGSGR